MSFFKISSNVMTKKDHFGKHYTIKDKFLDLFSCNEYIFILVKLILAYTKTTSWNSQ